MKYTIKKYDWAVKSREMDTSWLTEYTAIKEIYPDYEKFEIYLFGKIVYRKIDNNVNFIDNTYDFLEEEIPRVLKLCSQLDKIDK